MKGKFVIVDLRNRGFMLNEKGEINFYDTMDEACTVCGMYELENVWVMQLMYNHIEKTQNVCDECIDGSGWYGDEDITYNCSKCNPEAVSKEVEGNGVLADFSRRNEISERF